jgi:putative glutamine amidotransferase
MKKPIIGITLDLASDSEKYSYAKKPWYALRRGYSEMVAKAGGVPIFLPYDGGIDQFLDMIDGLVIPGGDEDVNPKFYGQKIISDRVKVNDARASFELGLVREAMRRDIPLLGICNGLQVINVACGGTLIQHIPDHHKSNVNHEQPAPKDVPSHEITILENSLLASLSQSLDLQVNSTHHQAIDELGDGLIVSARAPDGIIEAIESTNHKFVMGVQWHSEYHNSDLDLKLFERLVEESSKIG